MTQIIKEIDCTPTPTPVQEATPSATPTEEVSPTASPTPPLVPFVEGYTGANTTVYCDPNVGNCDQPVPITEAPRGEVKVASVVLPKTNGFDPTPVLVFGIILLVVGIAIKLHRMKS